MKNEKDEKSKLMPKEVELLVTQEDYETGLKRGWTDDDMLKPGRYKLKRGGFLARHPELKLKDKDRGVPLKLPNADRAVVDIAKLRDYCLNPAHPEGKHKARVFRSALGITQVDAEQLRQMILNTILTNEATEHAATPYGRRFAVDFEITRAQRLVMVRSTWILRNGEDFPRLTSCYVL